MVSNSWYENGQLSELYNYKEGKEHGIELNHILKMEN